MGELLKASHTTYELKYHFVWVVKYRKGILYDERVANKLREIFGEVGKRYWIEIGELATDGNHIHVFVQAAPRLAPAEIAQVMKSISARELFKAFPEIRDELWGGEFWGDGYFVRSVGEEICERVIRKYIREQGKATKHQRYEQMKLF